MKSNRVRLVLSSVALLTLLSASFSRAETFRVAAYNVANYLDTKAGTRPTKTAEAKAKVRESIRAIKPDVIAFEEMGGVSALMELRDSLKKEGLDFPHWEHVTGKDPDIHVAVLSKFPIVARRSHTNDSYLLSGRKFQVSRGFLEVDIKVNANYEFTLIGAHLKSKRPVPEGDEAAMRLEEAKLLREKVDAVLNANPNANLVVLGDFNDTKDTPSTKAIIGRGKNKLLDTRPAERNGDNMPPPVPTWDPANITWTHFYGKEDSYTRIDYIMLSPGMAKEWVKAETYIPTIPNWGAGSDHRPVTAAFEAQNK